MNRITSHILPLIERTLKRAPVNWRTLFQQAGLPLPVLGKKAPAYIELDQLLDAFALATQQAGDDHLLIRHYDIQAWSFYPTLYSSLLSLASDMRDLMSSYQRYLPLHASGDYRLRLHERGGYCEADFELDNTHPGGVQFLDFQLLMLTSVAERLSGSGFPALKIDLIRKHCDQGLYHVYYPGAQIRCGMPRTRVYADTEFFQRRFRPDHTPLPRVLAERAEREINELENESGFMRNLRVMLVHSMELGELNAELAASQLGMSRRSFFRKLQTEGLTFQQVLDGVRHNNALRFLLESDRRVDDIALLLGFAGENSFRRFFIKVEGMTPLKYRKKYK